MPKEVAKTKRPAYDPKVVGRLITRAEKGDESAALEIRKLLEQRPDLTDLLGGDLVRNAERALIHAMTGKRLAQREAIYAKLRKLRAELSGPNPQPLERPLVDRVVICWLHAYYADWQYGRRDGGSLEVGNYLQRQQDRAQRRYLAAIKSLANVRRLLLPIKVDITVQGKSTNNSDNSRRTPIDVDEAPRLQ